MKTHIFQNCKGSKSKNNILIFFVVLTVANFMSFYQPPKVNAASNSYTICDSGCDYTTLKDALTAPGLDGDTLIDILTITNDFTFDYADETSGGTTLNVPNGVTITCEASADTYGDVSETEIDLFVGENFTLDSCSFENVQIDGSGADNFTLTDNTFSSATDSWITLTSVDGFSITGNTGIRRLQLQGADNGTIENNTIDCVESNCIAVVTAGAPDFTDPPGDPLDDHICNSVTFEGNRIINYDTDTTGDWINVIAGEDINFIGNTIYSDVTVDDAYIVLISIQNAEVSFTKNYIITPNKTAGATNSTWAFNIRSDVYQIDATYENNTVIFQNEPSATNGDACLGLFDNGSTPEQPTVTVNFNNNLCYNTADDPSGSGISLSYDVGDITFVLNDSLNGFYNFNNLINDETGAITDLNTNTLTSDPLLRDENADTSDDYYPSPISRYLDADGTTDIGAYGDNGAVDRVATYTIDDDCTVDYTTCFSNNIRTIQDSVSDDDDITLAAGVYEPLTIDYPASNFSITGAGDSTIIDANGTGSPLSVIGVVSSEFSDFLVRESESNVVTTYEISHTIYEFGGSTYNETSGLGLPADDYIMIFTDASCTTAFYNADNYDVTSLVDTASDDWNLALVTAFGTNKITVIMPDRYIADETALVDYIANKCGVTATVDAYVDSVFEVSGGVYTYNVSAVAAESVTIGAAYTDPAYLQKIDTVDAKAGIVLDSSDNNTFTSISFDSNATGMYVDADSGGNDITESTFTNSGSYDIYSQAVADNNLIDAEFDVSSIGIQGAGNLNVYFTAKVTVYTKNNQNPVAGATVEFKDVASNLVETLTTGITGETPFSDPILSYVFDGAGPYSVTDGGFNPFTITVSSVGFNDKVIEDTFQTPQKSYIVNMRTGGGGSSILKPIISEFTINNGAQSTDNQQVKLHLQAYNVDKVKISNSLDFSESSWMNFSGNEEFDWDLIPGAGEKNVCVILISLGMNESDPVCRTIELQPNDSEPLEKIYNIEQLLSNINSISYDKSLEANNQILNSCADGGLIKLPSDNNPETQADTTVYYCGVDGKRYVFPNEKTYFSWYHDFLEVKIITPQEMSEIPIGGNVTLRPGLKVVKFTTNPKTYAVDRGGVLRWISDVEVLRDLYGENYKMQIVDISDAFFVNYVLGEHLNFENSTRQ